MITIIAAVELGGGIGNAGSTPWQGRTPADMERFKSLTTGHPVIMGRKTWDSLPPRYRPLPNRTNVVVSRMARAIDGCRVVPSLEMAVMVAKQHSGESGDVFVIGGGQIYQESLGGAHRLLITVVHEAHACDTFFPEDLGHDWLIIHEGYVAPEGGRPGLTFLTLEPCPDVAPAGRSGPCTARRLKDIITFAVQRLAASSP